MNLLIVDDKPARYESLVTRLRVGALKDGQIDVAVCISDALDRLRQTRYDILVVDMLLPETSWGKELTDGGAQLLQNIEEDDDLNRPSYIVGITAAVEDDARVVQAFEAGPWILLRDIPGAPNWEQRLETLISHSIAIDKEESSDRYRSDVCVLTALKTPEYAALLRSAGPWSDPILIDSATYVQKGSIISGDRTLEIIAASCSRMGSTESALLASKLVRTFQPRLVAMTGICAGYEDKTAYGDLIVADPTWDYELSSKIMIDETGVKRVEYAPDYIDIDPDISTRFELLSGDTAFLASIHAGWPADKPHGFPRIHVKPSACGPAVIADGQTIKSIRTVQNRDTHGLEMEAYGVYAAARTAKRPRPLVFSAKSVCDYGNYLKNDKYQAYAAYCSAGIVMEFFRRFGKDLLR